MKKKIREWLGYSLWIGTMTGMLSFPTTYMEGLWAVCIGWFFWLGLLAPMLGADED
jgi:hypothetical protein